MKSPVLHWFNYPLVFACLQGGAGFAATATAAVPTAETREIRGQNSWLLRNDQVELAVTQQGAQMAPVNFYRTDAAPVSPYYVSPWQGENLPLADVPVLVPLRGDFFCVPFGGNGTPYQGERHPPHGETCGSAWTLAGTTQADGVTTLSLALDTQVRRGRVLRELSLVAGQNVVYSRTLIEGFVGPTSLAHHAVLAMPETAGVVNITVRPFVFGYTAPYRFSDPAKGEYQALAIGAEFTDLAQVPVIFKDQPNADCTVFPARRGFADLLQTFNKPNAAGEPDWIAAVNTQEHWLWFALKNPAVQPGRVFWMENHGRHGSPWNGRNSCLGIEDGCNYFDAGLAESVADNLVNRRGIPTSHVLTGKTPFAVNYIQGVVKVPVGFGKVSSVRFLADAVEFTATTGETVRAPVRAAFVFDGKVAGSTVNR